MNNTKLTIDELAEKIVKEDVFCNVGSLVEFSIAKSYEGDQDAPVTYEDFYPSTPDFEEWTKKELKDWLVDNVYTDKSELKGWDHDDLVSECEDNFTPDEPLEYWAVSNWLAAKLQDQGEVVADSYPMIWGRCTSGQAIKMDGVIQRIAKNLYES
jgi:hypothetical protein